MSVQANFRLETLNVLNGSRFYVSEVERLKRRVAMEHLEQVTYLFESFARSKAVERFERKLKSSNQDLTLVRPGAQKQLPEALCLLY